MLKVCGEIVFQWHVFQGGFYGAENVEFLNIWGRLFQSVGPLGVTDLQPLSVRVLGMYNKFCCLGLVVLIVLTCGEQRKQLGRWFPGALNVIRRWSKTHFRWMVNHCNWFKNGVTWSNLVASPISLASLLSKSWWRLRYISVPETFYSCRLCENRMTHNYWSGVQVFHHHTRGASCHAWDVVMCFWNESSKALKYALGFRGVQQETILVKIVSTFQ